MILTKTTHIFLYFIANTLYNSATTDLIHQGGCLVDEKLSLSRVKIVHGPLKLQFTQYRAIHTNYSLSNCTISNKNDFNRSSDFLVIN